MTATQVDPATYTFTPTCDRCEAPATVRVKGCMDKEPVSMCEAHFARGLEVISEYVHLYQRHNRRAAICGDCHRPILTLDTHLEVTRL